MSWRELLPDSFLYRRPRYRVRYWIHALHDARDTLLRRRPPLLPPRRLISMVGGNFEETGRSIVRYLVERGGLRPEHRVLDVGCGVGRVAVPLTGYLSEEGGYEGFDVDPALIRWCQRNVTPRFPHFRFQVSDVYNRFYTPNGRVRASEYRFPFPDASFDFVFLTSVFTHMLPADLENYLSEVARVLRPGGRSVITYLLLTGDSLRGLEEGRSALDLRYEFDGCRTLSLRNPEDGIAYPEETIRALYDRHGLEIEEPVSYGSWYGRKGVDEFQDAIVAVRKGTTVEA